MINIIHGILLILYIIDCIALTVVVLMQEGKQAGLTGAISGAAESYWGKNKGRSMEGGLTGYQNYGCAFRSIFTASEPQDFQLR